MNDTPALKTSPEVLCMALPRYALRNSPYSPGYLDEESAEGEWCRYEDVLKLLAMIEEMTEIAS